MQIPGCQYTAWGPLGLATSLSSPTGVARDTKHLLSLTLAHTGDLLSSYHIGWYYPVQAYPCRFQAVNTLHGVSWDSKHLYLVQQGSPGTQNTSLVWRVRAFVLDSCRTRWYYPVQAYPCRFQAVNTLHGVRWDSQHLYLVQQGSPGTQNTSWVLH